MREIIARFWPLATEKGGVIAYRGVFLPFSKMGSLAYLDCFAGLSGDMILGAFLDLGVPLEVLQRAWGAVGLEVRARAEKVSRRGIAGTKLQVEIASRRMSPDEMRLRISQSSLSPWAKGRALEALDLLRRAEAAVHGTERAHFHELGDPDTLLDLVGAVVAVEHLGLEEVASSRVALARGTVQTEHGPLPSPCPATLEILQGVPIAPSPLTVENVTPTGAALLKVLVRTFGPIPEMVLEGVGYGAGSMDPPELPNLLRVLVGRRGEGVEGLWLLETDMDDMNPEIVPYVEERLREAGALEVTVAPVHMKKGRMGMTLRCLCREGERQRLLEVLFGESSTLGVRGWRLKRWILDRETVEVSTAFGPVKVKVGRKGDRVLNVAPEYESCQEVALREGVPLKEVYQEALRAATASLGKNKKLVDREGLGPLDDV